MYTEEIAGEAAELVEGIDDAIDQLERLPPPDQMTPKQVEEFTTGAAPVGRHADKLEEYANKTC